MEWRLNEASASEVGEVGGQQHCPADHLLSREKIEDKTGQDPMISNT